MRQIFSSGSSAETCALPRATAAAAEALAAAASASAFCANAADPITLAAMRQPAVNIQIFLIPSSLGPHWGETVRPLYRAAPRSGKGGRHAGQCVLAATLRSMVE